MTFFTPRCLRASGSKFPGFIGGGIARDRHLRGLHNQSPMLPEHGRHGRDWRDAASRPVRPSDPIDMHGRIALMGSFPINRLPGDGGGA